MAAIVVIFRTLFAGIHHQNTGKLEDSIDTLHHHMLRYTICNFVMTMNRISIQLNALQSIQSLSTDSYYRGLLAVYQ